MNKYQITKLITDLETKLRRQEDTVTATKEHIAALRRLSEAEQTPQSSKK